jgi:hypothetical protein
MLILVRLRLYGTAERSSIDRRTDPLKHEKIQESAYEHGCLRVP